MIESDGIFAHFLVDQGQDHGKEVPGRLSRGIQTMERDTHQPETHDAGNPYDIIIIGAGPAGLFGTFYAGMRHMSTLLIDALPEMGGQLIALYPEKYIYDVPGFPKILARDLVQNLVEQALQYHPTVRMGEQVTTLRHADADQQVLEVITTRGTYYGRSVLIAVGVGAFAPNKLPIPGIEEFEGRGVYYFVKEKSLFEDKQVLIVGGGDSAVDWALDLHERARKVTLIHRREGFRAHESSVQALHASPVDVKVFYELRGIYGNGQVERATIINNQTQETEDIEVDAVLLSLGFKANLGPMKEWGIPIDKRTIPVDRNQATPMRGVFAAGDIAGTTVKLDLITVGFAQAAIAVNSAKTFVDPEAKLFAGHSSSMSV
jgi:thioredoxin reductase (NADPH)